MKIKIDICDLKSLLGLEVKPRDLGTEGTINAETIFSTAREAIMNQEEINRAYNKGFEDGMSRVSYHYCPCRYCGRFPGDPLCCAECCCNFCKRTKDMLDPCRVKFNCPYCGK